MKGRGERTQKRGWLCVKDRVQLLYRFSRVWNSQNSKPTLSPFPSGDLSENRNSVTLSAFSHGEGTVPMALFRNFEFYTLFWQVLVPTFPLRLFFPYFATRYGACSPQAEAGRWCKAVVSSGMGHCERARGTDGPAIPLNLLKNAFHFFPNQCSQKQLSGPLAKELIVAGGGGDKPDKPPKKPK